MHVHGTLDQAYAQTIHDVLHCPHYLVKPRGMAIKEILGYTFTVVEPTDGIPITTACEERNKVIAAYTKAEFELYESLSRDSTEYARAASFWKNIANPDGTINSAYGYLIFDRKVAGNPCYESLANGAHTGDVKGTPLMRTPWQWAMLALKSDKDTRQAIMHFNTPDVLYVGNKDVVCTIVAQFFIREDLLHLFITMRSNDVVLGLVYDCVWFSSLMHKAVKELLPTYPNLQVGNYTHTANSMHIYERHFDLAERMIKANSQ